MNRVGAGKKTLVITVLLADDTVEIRRLLRMTLEADGRFTVVDEAGDGVAAVRIAKEKKPDVVVLDLAMPVMDGLQAIPEIRSATPKTKILVLSGFDAAQMSGEALARGAHAYIEKGGELDDLADAVAALCSNGQ
ncbi:MAG: response regulator transcription factor [Actinomycetota bacterium]|nr:response regulator transcription factor [Actinomycetota bacterium]